MSKLKDIKPENKFFVLEDCLYEVVRLFKSDNQIYMIETNKLTRYEPRWIYKEETVFFYKTSLEKNVMFLEMINIK